MARDVLLRSVERVSQSLDRHLPIELKALDHPDSQRLGKDRQAMSDLVHQHIRDRVQYLHVSFLTRAAR